MELFDYADRLLINVFNLDAALIVARAKGLFAAAGLDVSYGDAQLDGTNARTWQRVLQIVSTAFDNVLGWSGREGAEIVAISQVARRKYFAHIRQAGN